MVQSRLSKQRKYWCNSIIKSKFLNGPGGMGGVPVDGSMHTLYLAIDMS